ncbi:MAG: putative phosphodiesterase [Saprospiraceae bacterium]|jgi:predicted phosphodiesterase
MRFIRLLALLLLAAVLIFVSIGYLFTYRYPGLRFDPIPLTTELNPRDVTISAQGAYVKDSKQGLFRAFSPHISFAVEASKQTEVSISLENVHPQAQVIFDEAMIFQEHVMGLKRTISFTTGKNSLSTFKVQFPEKDKYRFGAIGDSGGDSELAWGLKRLASQDVDFILHLGDGYYTPDNVGNVQIHFNQAAVPVYATNGNHDFHAKEWLTVETYMQNIGPLNNRFKLLNHCFINLETGGFMFPTHGGDRGRFLRETVQQLTTTPNECQPIIFTHKPILSNLDLDIPQVKHTLYGYDSRWILKQLHKLPNPVLLAGHIHQDFEFTQDGIKTYVTGSGLAQDDLLAQGFVAKLLIGEINADGELSTQWITNEMPLNYHCSQKVRNSLQHKMDKKSKPKKKAKYAQLLKKLSAACGN